MIETRHFFTRSTMHTVSKLFVAVVLASTLTQSVQACGDKFIRIGREVRFGRYVAI